MNGLVFFPQDNASRPGVRLSSPRSGYDINICSNDVICVVTRSTS
jgi:hypothetical protein